MKNLIIVESFAKSKTIAKYLDNKYNVIASFGHINELNPSNLSIDTNTWQGSYMITNPKVLKNIRDHVKQCDITYIASDPDHEGEAISYHIYNNIKDLLKNKLCYRIRFNEITKKAITDAINNPTDIDMDMVDAQESRRFIDRLVGYSFSPLLWKQFNDNTLSVGRVQSVGLLMCCEMLNKIKGHDIDPYWIVIGKYSVLDFKLHQDSNILKITDKDSIKKLLDILHFNNTHTISYIDSQSSESPPPPYTTTSLQQDAYNKCRFSSKKTMQLAQQLYENGLITYMRTDSTNISNDFKNVIIKYVNERYGPQYSKFRNFKNKIANAQEAHEAIRVTHVNTMLSEGLSEDHNKLYKLIWKRTIASQMINAEYHNLDIILTYPEFEDKNYSFVCKKSFLMQKGYLMVYNESAETEDPSKFKSLSLKAKEFLCEASIDNPPSLYNEVGLIKALEKEGIGRPSTYASIIDKILSKKYVQRGQNPQQTITLRNYIKTKTGMTETDNKINIGGKAKDLLVPTELGINIVSYLQSVVPYLLDIKFTAKMEDSLDKICEKYITKEQLLTDFYRDFIVPVMPSSNTQTLQQQQSKKMESGIIKTKYGYCYYHASAKRYTNIESYLKWKNITVEQLQEKDIKFLRSLPKKLSDGTELHIGPYGLYIKNKNKNCKLDQSKWESFLS